MITRMPPRFSIDRKTGQVTCHKLLTGEEVKMIQTAILIKQTELHPELLTDRALRESNEFGENIESSQGTPSKKEP